MRKKGLGGRKDIKIPLSDTSDREKPRADWKNDLQICGPGNKITQKAHAGLGHEIKWEIPVKMNSEKIGMRVPPDVRRFDEWAFLPLKFGA